MNTLLSTTIILLLTSNLFANENNVDLENIVLETPNKIKTKKEYEKKEDLLVKPYPSNSKEVKSKEDKITFDAGVDFNKKEKDIDGANVNIGVKF